MYTSFLRYAPTVLLHALIWSLVSMLLALPPGPTTTLPGPFWLKQGVLLAVLMVVFYANSLWAVPQLLYRGRGTGYVLLLVGTILSLLVLNQQLDQRLHIRELLEKARNDHWRSFRPSFHRGASPSDEPSSPPRPPGPPRPGEGRHFINVSVLLICLLVVGMSTGLSVVQKSQRDAEVRQQLEQARLATELSLLKAQINPHFFFNTLNNIYSLTLIDGDQARTALHQLSRMMRYVLYETPADTTLLSQEITFLRDYIDLMHLRLTDEVTVTFETPQPLHNVPLAPMLLLPYVENAFKHGINPDGDSHIYVAVRQPTLRTLELEVRNHLFVQKASLDEGGGIGLVNTRRRLELLYPGHHTLTVTERTPANEYRVQLLIEVG